VEDAACVVWWSREGGSEKEDVEEEDGFIVDRYYRTGLHATH